MRIKDALNEDNNSKLNVQVRPTTLDDFIGQEQLIGTQGILRTLMEQDKIPYEFYSILTHSLPDCH